MFRRARMVAACVVLPSCILLPELRGEFGHQVQGGVLVERDDGAWLLMTWSPGFACRPSDSTASGGSNETCPEGLYTLANLVDESSELSTSARHSLFGWLEGDLETAHAGQLLYRSCSERPDTWDDEAARIEATLDGDVDVIDVEGDVAEVEIDVAGLDGNIRVDVCRANL
jgi:hypothetical protein